MFKVWAKNLDQVYVVCKKQKGQYFFVANSSQKTDSFVTKACTFDNKVDAQKEADVWTKAQKVKFVVEPLSKFMANNFTAKFDQYSRVISVESKLEPLSRLKRTGSKGDINHDLENRRSTIINGMNVAISQINSDTEWRRKRLILEKESHDKVIEELQKAIAINDEKLKDIVAKQEELKNVDLNSIIEPLITKTDKAIKVLYGKESKAIEITNTGCVSVSILPDDDNCPF